MSARVALCALLLVAAAAPASIAVPSAAPSGATGAEIATVYPNPAAAEDRGEFVTVRFADATALGNWTVSDGETVAHLPNRTVEGVVAISATPDAARDVSERPVVGLRDSLALANGGDEVELRRDGRPVDAIRYGDAPEGERWLVDREAWRPLGATAFEASTAENASTVAFALPDAPEIPLGVLRNASRRIYLAGYTLTSGRVVRALRRASDRGVEVRVLVEGGPVGGTSLRQARRLDALEAGGATVTVVAGPLARYRYHHAKYAVVDDRALVTSENWKPAGIGGRSSRGWGVVVDDAALAADLATLFEADAGWRDGVPWSVFRRNRTFRPANPNADASGPGSANGDAASDGRYPSRFRPREVRAERVRLLAAPDNAERGIRGLLRSADREILVEQMSVDPEHPFLREVVAAARRGVRVRVLLSDAWYAREENRRVVERLEGIAASEGLPLDAKLVNPRSRFEKIHVKGVVVDGERALVGSVNWNNVSVRENREVALVLEGDAVGGYYRRLFLADWRGGAWRLSAGVLVALAACVLGTVAAFRRRIRFAGERSSDGVAGVDAPEE